MDSTQKPRTVIVVGGGLAGLAACIEAYNNNANVVIIEKNARLGGNSALASSGINAVHTDAQKKMNSADSFEAFFQDTIKSGGQMDQSGQLVHILVHESPDAATFLTKFGVDLSLVSQCGAHSFARTHRAKPREDGKVENVGWHIMSKLIQHVESLPRSRLRIVTNAQAKKLLQDKSGHVVGVNYSVTLNDYKGNRDVNVFGDSVILATGGYSADKLLLSEFCQDPTIPELPTTNSPGTLGEGVKMARQIGAELIDMQQVQLHPTGIVDLKEPFAQKKWLAPEAFRGCGGILLNSKGERFVNELGGRDFVTDHIFKHCSKLEHTGQLKEGERIPVVSYLIMNDTVAKNFDIKIFEFYKGKGLIHTVANAQELSQFIKCDFNALKKSIEEYNEVANRKDNKVDKFGRTLFPSDFKLEEPFHVVVTTPSLHYTMGGVRISDRAEVMTKDNKPIPGLFGAGEVTGGVHGKNRLAGNSLLECVVFGRRAGQSASKYVGKALTTSGISRKPDFVDENGVLHEAALDPEKWIPLRLRERFQMNKTTHLFAFDLPSPTMHSGLLAGQYIAVKMVSDGKDVVRYYSPISRNSTYGKIELLVKIEEDKAKEGCMTHYLNLLKPGNTLDFKGPLGGFEYHRNTYKEIGMIAGGTGISPMMQIMRSIVAHPEDNTQVKLLYGNYFEDDILCKDELMYLSSTRTNISSYITLNNPPPKWSMGVGFITEDMIKKYLPAPAKDIKIIMCGPPVMMDIMKKLLRQIGYTDEMFYSFI